MKKGNSLILISVLFSTVVFSYIQKQLYSEINELNHKKYQLLIDKRDCLMERNILKKELNNQKYISLLLFNYSDYKKVKKDTTLQRLIFKYDNN